MVVSARWVILTAVALVCVALVSGETRAAPKADLWERWAAHDSTSMATIDHQPWSRFLAAYVRRDPDGINRIDYANVTTAARVDLMRYIDMLANTRITAFARSEQLAYWINLYNAVTVKLVLDYFPVAGIREIPGESRLFFVKGPWTRRLVTVEGAALSLDDIEHRILRPIWRDARIHYAVNCASLGCPDLMPVAFTAANAGDLLTQGAIGYVNHPRGVALIGGELVVSSLYYWYRDDFGGSDAGVIDHLRRYAKPPLRRALEGVTLIARYRYDWRLNAADPVLTMTDEPGPETTR